MHLYAQAAQRLDMDHANEAGADHGSAYFGKGPRRGVAP
jgi:hypothetical protein